MASKFLYSWIIFLNACLFGVYPAYAVSIAPATIVEGQQTTPVYTCDSIDNNLYNVLTDSVTGSIEASSIGCTASGQAGNFNEFLYDLTPPADFPAIYDLFEYTDPDDNTACGEYVGQIHSRADIILYCEALTSFVSRTTLNISETGSAIITMPGTASADMLANVGYLFADLWIIIALIAGIPLAFYIIQKIINAISNVWLEKKEKR